MLQFPLLAELLSYLCKGFAGFIGTGTGDQAIVEAFPQFTILLEIDEHGGFLAFIIHNELSTFYKPRIVRKALATSSRCISSMCPSTRMIQRVSITRICSQSATDHVTPTRCYH